MYAKQTEINDDQVAGVYDDHDDITIHDHWINKVHTADVIAFTWSYRVHIQMLCGFMSYKIIKN